MSPRAAERGDDGPGTATATATTPRRCSRCGVPETPTREVHQGTCRACYLRGNSNDTAAALPQLQTSAPPEEQLATEPPSAPFLLAEESVPSPRPSPSSPKKEVDQGNGAGDDVELAFNDQLLAECDAGRLDGIDVTIRALPEDAPVVCREVYEDFVKVYGLRLASACSDPVPYGCAWVGARIGRHKTVVARWLRWLTERGILVRAGNMPSRGDREGTRLYVPGEPLPVPPGAGAVEGLVGSADALGADPEAEPVDRGSVVTAEVGQDGVAGAPAAGPIAVGDRAGGLLLKHVRDANASRVPRSHTYDNVNPDHHAQLGPDFAHG
jgi:hypothetical protein